MTERNKFVLLKSFVVVNLVRYYQQFEFLWFLNHLLHVTPAENWAERVGGVDDKPKFSFVVCFFVDVLQIYLEILIFQQFIGAHFNVVDGSQLLKERVSYFRHQNIVAFFAKCHHHIVQALVHSID